jgi:hypothetical protein
MSWINPWHWYLYLQDYAKKHFLAWHVSGAQTWAVAFGLSAAYPPWAQDLATKWLPLFKEAALTLWEVAWDGRFGP